MRLINLTPHPISIAGETVGRLSLPKPPAGTTLPRVAADRQPSVHGDLTVDGHRLRRVVTTLGAVEGLPPRQDGKVFIVSALVLHAAPTDRDDLAAPGELIRDAEGRPVACRGLVVRA